MSWLLVSVLLSLCIWRFPFGLARREASGVGILLRKPEEDDDAGIRVDRKRSRPFERLLTRRFQLDLSAGFLGSMLDGGFGLRSISGNGVVGMIPHVQGQFSVGGDQFEVIGPGSKRLSAVQSRDRAGVLRLVGVDRHRPEEERAERYSTRKMFHDSFSQKTEFISSSRVIVNINVSADGGDGDVHRRRFLTDPPEVSRLDRVWA
jgi:hypothetical protein